MKEQIRELRSQVWNVPNMLTILRLILVPVLVVVYCTGHTYWSLAIFVIASLTDCLDGYIARTRHQITSFGKLMDPLADKLMVCATLICMGTRGIFPWGAIILVGVKEVIMIIGGTYMLNKGIVVYSNIVGKVGTCSFIASLIVGFLHDDLLAAGYPLIDVTLLWVSIGMALCALVNYAVFAWKELQKDSQQQH